MTVVPGRNVAEHVAGGVQLMPLGLLVTMPELGSPSALTVKTGSSRSNLAWTVIGLFRVKVHGAVPGQFMSPGQPVNVESLFGVAVRVITVPC